MGLSLLTICYLVGSITFIIGLKMLSNPATARRGNLVAAFGMGIAILGTIFLYRDSETHQHLHNYAWIFGGLLIGGVVGTMAAKKVKMTAMPEMVSLFNGMGGACAALISLIEYYSLTNPRQVQDNGDIGTLITSIANAVMPETSTGKYITIVAGLIIGSVSFAGSMIAFMKLNGMMKKSIRLPKYNILNTVLMIVTALFAVYLCVSRPENYFLIFILFAFALLYGVMFVI